MLRVRHPGGVGILDPLLKLEVGGRKRRGLLAVMGDPNLDKDGRPFCRGIPPDRLAGVTVTVAEEGGRTVAGFRFTPCSPLSWHSAVSNPLHPSHP